MRSLPGRMRERDVKAGATRYHALAGRVYSNMLLAGETARYDQAERWEDISKSAWCKIPSKRIIVVLAYSLRTKPTTTRKTGTHISL